MPLGQRLEEQRRATTTDGAERETTTDAERTAADDAKRVAADGAERKTTTPPNDNDARKKAEGF